MITLRPFLYGQDAYGEKQGAVSDLQTAVACYCASLLAFGKGAAQDGSSHGLDLDQALHRLERRVSTKPSGDVVAKVNKQVLAQVERWGESVAEDSKAKADEIKQLLIALGRTAESIGSRDVAYRKTFNDLMGGLEHVTTLNDLTQIKSSLVTYMDALKHCVDQMVSDNQQLVSQLSAQVTAYEHKLKSAEDIAFQDELTGIANRRCVERQLQWNIRHNEKFCVAMFDLNRFKPVNDRYGHRAGDDLLRQFASELRTHTRAEDLLARWGGDEFVVVMMCEMNEAMSYVGHIQQWVVGKYFLKLENGDEVRVFIDAAVGLAEWQRGMSASKVVEAADEQMYLSKQTGQKKR
jgi:diguanylate cyclase (GGDEF)-like protein